MPWPAPLGPPCVQVLAKKMTVLYKLSKEQLSKQHHYDFGLRALKSVLVMAGSLKRGAPDMSEQLVLMRALRDMNLPKFVFDDVPLFLGLINDLFPGGTQGPGLYSWARAVLPGRTAECLRSSRPRTRCRGEQKVPQDILYT